MMFNIPKSSELDDAASYISSMNGRPNFLEIEYSEKQINEIKAQIELKKEKLDETNSLKEERNSHLEHKKNELDSIMKETEKEENELVHSSSNDSAA